MAGISSMSSAQIVSASAIHNRTNMFGTPGITGNAVPMHTMLTSPGQYSMHMILYEVISNVM